MKKLLLVLFVLAFFVGCNGTEKPVENESDIPMPDWFLNPPTEPGKAFYATGIYTMDNPEEIALAKKTAAARARAELAASLKAKIQSLLEDYAKKMTTASGKKAFEKLTMSVMREVVNQDIYGARVVKNEIKKYKDQLLFYALVKVGFDGVAKAIHNTAKKEFEELGQHAQEGFDKLDKLLGNGLTEQSNNVVQTKGDGTPELPVPATP